MKYFVVFRSHPQTPRKHVTTVSATSFLIHLSTRDPLTDEACAPGAASSDTTVLINRQIITSIRPVYSEVFEVLLSAQTLSIDRTEADTSFASTVSIQ
jgi:hypothetical protein